MRVLASCLRAARTTAAIMALCLMAAVQPALGQTDMVPDVDSLGDIWVVTIDNTFSMRSRHGIPQNMVAAGQGVERRLAKSELLSHVNWEADRFLILKSGIQEGARVKYIDTEFIRHTDRKLHRYNDQNDFARAMGTAITNGDYHNYVSFVSQMRLLSLHTALEYLAADSAQKSYREIRIMTISDDAVDQHDQWSTDYRTLKECAPEKVDYLGNLAHRYIYNPLNGWGGGDMALEWSDETMLPHIWVYSYVTAEGRREADSAGVHVAVKAGDGHHLSFRLKDGEPQTCLCRIDSVCVNGSTIAVGQYLTDRLEVEADYRNGALSNKVDIYGKVQIDYTDSILGDHYRVVDFVQHSNVMPRHISAIVNAIALLLIIAAVAALLYLLWLLPRKVLFDVYDASGRRHRVRRGYRWQWRGNIVPLLTLVVDQQSKTAALALQDSKVENTPQTSKPRVDESNRVLIVSRQRVRLSADSTNHNSGIDDIENYYNTQEDYPTLLRSCYRATAECRYFIMQHSTRWFDRTAGRLLLKAHLLLFGSINYSYYRQGETAVSVESPALAGKLFLIEKGVLPRGCNPKNYIGQLYSTGEHQIRMQLLNHYTSTQKPGIGGNSDVLLILSQQTGWRVWDVVRTAQASKGQVSLCNATWVYHYALPGTDDKKAISWERRALTRYLRRTYHCRVAFADHRNEPMSYGLAMTCFNLTHAFAKEFLSLVSTETEAVVTPMYDPFRDGHNSSKQFMIKSNNDNLRSTNHLYGSFLPQSQLPRKNAPYYTEKLSDTLVPFSGRDQAVTLEITDEKHYRIHGLNITVKRQ